MKYESINTFFIKEQLPGGLMDLSLHAFLSFIKTLVFCATNTEKKIKILRMDLNPNFILPLAW